MADKQHDEMEGTPAFVASEVNTVFKKRGLDVENEAITEDTPALAASGVSTVSQGCSADVELMWGLIKELQTRYNANVMNRFPNQKASTSTGRNGGGWNIKEGCTHPNKTMDDADQHVKNKFSTLSAYCSHVNQQKPKSLEPTTYTTASGKTLHTMQHTVPEDQLMSKQQVNAARKLPISFKLMSRDAQPASICGKRSSMAKEAINCNFSVVQEGSTTPQLLLLRNHLSVAATVGLYALSLYHLLTSRGWMKGCEASGLVTHEKVRAAMNRLGPVQEWGAHPDQLKSVNITSTRGSGMCASTCFALLFQLDSSINPFIFTARISYTNRDGNLKSFQGGNFLDRKKYDDFKKDFEKNAPALGLAEFIPYVQQYGKEIESTMLEYGPLLVDNKTAQALAMDPAAARELLAATNIVDNGNSQLCAHQDKPSLLPTLITGMNPAGQERSYSKGNFLLVQGLVQVDYGAGDVLLTNGSNLHAVTHLCPHAHKKMVTRFSVVHFSRRTPGDPMWQHARYLPTTLELGSPSDSDETTKDPMDIDPTPDSATYKCGPYNLRSNCRISKIE